MVVSKAQKSSSVPASVKAFICHLVRMGQFAQNEPPANDQMRAQHLGSISKECIS
jgi:hypothetical protein